MAGLKTNSGISPTANGRPEDRKAFQKAVAPVWKKYRKKIGNEIFDFMLSKIKENEP